MITGQYYHEAVGLIDGSVLAVGGAGDRGSAQRYDPSTMDWTARPNLPGLPGVSCCGHTSTRLADGRVLVVGGDVQDPGAVLALAVLYDPVTGTWSSTESLPASRFGHTATLLPNGDVLVAGGTTAEGTPASALLYSPSAQSWMPTGNMIEPTDSATSTLLRDGKVLLVGTTTDAAEATAQLYDPISGSWTVTGKPISARYNFTATLLSNGMVLVAGGASTSAPYRSLTTAEIYDASSRTWTTTGYMISRRQSHTATLLADGTVLVAGGFGDGLLTSAELYDPATGTWAATGDMISGRNNHAATRLQDGNVLVTGGYIEGGEPLTSAELYIVEAR